MARIAIQQDGYNHVLQQHRGTEESGADVWDSYEIK